MLKRDSNSSLRAKKEKLCYFYFILFFLVGGARILPSNTSFRRSHGSSAITRTTTFWEYVNPSTSIKFWNSHIHALKQFKKTNINIVAASLAILKHNKKKAKTWRHIWEYEKNTAQMKRYIDQQILFPQIS